MCQYQRIKITGKEKVGNKLSYFGFPIEIGKKRIWNVISCTLYQRFGYCCRDSFSVTLNEHFYDAISSLESKCDQIFETHHRASKQYHSLGAQNFLRLKQTKGFSSQVVLIHTRKKKGASKYYQREPTYKTSFKKAVRSITILHHKLGM